MPQDETIPGMSEAEFKNAVQRFTSECLIMAEAMEAFGRKDVMHMCFKAEPEPGTGKKALCVQTSLGLVPEEVFDEEWEEASERGVPNERMPDRTFDA